MQRFLNLGLAVLLLTPLATADKKADAENQIRKAVQASEVRSEGSRPFRLEAHGQLVGKHVFSASYTLLWADRQHWREEIRVADDEEIWVRSGDTQWISRKLGYSPLRVRQFRSLFSDKSATSLDKVEIKHARYTEAGGLPLNCANVQIETPERAVSNGEICVNATSGLPATREISETGPGNQKQVSYFENYSSFGDKQYARTLRFVEGGKTVAEASVDRMAAENPEPSLLAALPGIDAWPTCDHVKHPEPTHTPDPEYTDEARKKRIQGTVSLYALIGTNGLVSKTAVLQSLEPGLDVQAQRAVQTWKFKPALCGTQTVPAEITIDVTFRLFN